jgi:hypothetical protein
VKATLAFHSGDGASFYENPDNIHTMEHSSDAAQNAAHEFDQSLKILEDDERRSLQERKKRKIGLAFAPRLAGYVNEEARTRLEREMDVAEALDKNLKNHAAIMDILDGGTPASFHEHRTETPTKLLDDRLAALSAEHQPAQERADLTEVTKCLLQPPRHALHRSARAAVMPSTAGQTDLSPSEGLGDSEWSDAAKAILVMPALTGIPKAESGRWSPSQLERRYACFRPGSHHVPSGASDAPALASAAEAADTGSAAPNLLSEVPLPVQMSAHSAGPSRRVLPEEAVATAAATAATTAATSFLALATAHATHVMSDEYTKTPWGWRKNRNRQDGAAEDMRSPGRVHRFAATKTSGHSNRADESSDSDESSDPHESSDSDEESAEESVRLRADDESWHRYVDAADAGLLGWK